MICFKKLAFVAFLLSVTAAPSPKSLQISDCEVEGITNYDHTNELIIEENYAGVVAEFPSTGITGVHIEEGTYLDVSIKEKKIVIETTDAFSNFENDTGPMYAPIRFSTKIVVECEEGSSTLNFHQNVKDINSQDPYFNRGAFEFKYGMSLRQGFELTKYFTIFGMDDDLTHGQVEFAISGDLFEISRSDSVDRGNYAKLKLLKDITMPFDQEFEITVTDGGVDPLRTTTAKLRLILTENGAPVVSPLFTKPFWTLKYDTVQNILLDSEQVTLSQGFGSGLKVKQIGYEDYFATELEDPEKNQITVELTKALSQEIIKEQRIFLNLEAEFPTARQIAKASVMIEMV